MSEVQVEKGPPPEPLPAPSGDLDDTSCPDGSGCFWELADYGGGKRTVGTASAGTWHDLGTFDRSAKNRFGNRRIQFAYYDGQSYSITYCLNAGDNDSNLLAAINSFKVGAQGTSC